MFRSSGSCEKELKAEQMATEGDTSRPTANRNGGRHEVFETRVGTAWQEDTEKIRNIHWQLTSHAEEHITQEEVIGRNVQLQRSFPCLNIAAHAAAVHHFM